VNAALPAVPRQLHRACLNSRRRLWRFHSMGCSQPVDGVCRAESGARNPIALADLPQRPVTAFFTRFARRQRRAMW